MKNFLAPILGRSRPNRVRNLWGVPLPCCWNDCWADGSTDHQVVVPHDQPKQPGDTLTYIFCSDMHRRFWISATFPAEHRGLVLGNDLTHLSTPARKFFRP